MALTVGFDIGGTKIAAGVVDEAGVVTAESRRKTPSRDPEAVEMAVVELALEFKAQYDIEAIGIGAAGFVDANRSRILLAPNLGWKDEPLRLAVESEVKLPVVVENDANAAAWGESRFGAGRGVSDLICVTIGTGIGGGFIFNDQLYRGAGGMAAEVGHMNVQPGGRLCGCGNRGCWEQYASGNALVREARLLAAERRDEAEVLLDLGDGTPEGVQGPHITAAARKGDAVALAAFDSLARWLGHGIADLTAVLDPGRIVMGGGVSEAGDLLLGAVRTAFVNSVSGAESRHVPDIKLAEMGNAAGIVGAADLARH